MHRLMICFMALGLAGASLGSPAWADPPGGFKHDKNKGQGHHQNGPKAKDARGPASVRFADRDRDAVRGYFAAMERGGKCPPGLAKKGNGCMPPGQAKRWNVGAPLPRDVAYVPLPADLLVQITPPPVGYQYVRVASDILMIAVGTGMVVSAIEDLGR